MKLFVLENPKAAGVGAVTDFEPIDGSPMGHAPQCRLCGGFVGLMPLVPPIRINLVSWGESWSDIAFGPGDQILISARLKGAFAQAGLSGVERYDPAAIEKVTRKHRSFDQCPPKYFLATISRSRAMIDDLASGLEREDDSACPECGLDGIIKRLRRVELKSEYRVEEDIFFARGLPGRILVSQRFMTMCEKLGLAKCFFIETDNFSFDYYQL